MGPPLLCLKYVYRNKWKSPGRAKQDNKELFENPSKSHYIFLPPLFSGPNVEGHSSPKALVPEHLHPGHGQHSKGQNSLVCKIHLKFHRKWID